MLYFLSGSLLLALRVCVRSTDSGIVTLLVFSKFHEARR